MTTPAKIVPCPFCGAEGVIEKPPKGMRGYSSLVGCSNKDCRLGSVAFDSLEEWNRRAHAPEQPEWEAGAGTKMTTKLQRYNVAGSQAGNWPSKDGDWCVSRDVAALEAENEMVREALAGFINWSSGHGHHELNTLRREGLAILNATFPAAKEQP